MQNHSRRGFIRVVAGALAAIGIGPTKAFAADTLSSAEFQAMVRSRFYFSNSDATSQGKVKLLSVEEISTDGGVTQFNLHFRGNRGVSLTEDLYSTTNWSGHPYFDVYVRQVGVDSRGRELYVANFAQLQ